MKKSSAIVLVLFAVALMFTHTQATEKSEQAGATVTSVADGTELAPRAAVSIVHTVLPPHTQYSTPMEQVSSHRPSADPSRGRRIRHWHS